MINVKRGFSDLNDSKQAIESVISSIKQPDTRLVMFFVSQKYDFELVSKVINAEFLSAEVIGCTTAGEIGPKGFTENSIVAMSIAADDFTPASVIIKDVDVSAMLSKNDIVNAISKTGMDLNSSNLKQQGFGIMLIDGLKGTEEKMLSGLNSILDDFTIVGGSAGDGMDFKKVYVSANGEVFTNAAVITFVKTNKKFTIHKENIYVPTDIEFKVTKCDIPKRIVYEFNNRPAADVYAEALGIKSKDLSFNNFKSNPIGRQFGDSIWITSPFQVFDDGSIQFFSQIMPNATVKLLKPINSIEEAKKSVKEIKSKVANPKVVICFNCLLRYLQFKEENSCPSIYNELSSLGETIGFNCYGEQYGKFHVNQTLTLIAIGE